MGHKTVTIIVYLIDNIFAAEDFMVNDSEFAPFPSKVFALLFMLVHSPHPIVSDLICVHAQSFFTIVLFARENLI